MKLAAWSRLTEQERQDVQSLQIADSQIDYAGTTDSAVALAVASDGEDLVGLAIFDDSNVVGFLLLKRSSAAPDWVPDNAAAVSSLRIDLAHQSKGLGRRALQHLPQWVHHNWPKVEQLVLSVDADNHAGIHAYTAAGWEDNGQRFNGRVGLERRMTFPLTTNSDRQ